MIPKEKDSGAREGERVGDVMNGLISCTVTLLYMDFSSYMSRRMYRHMHTYDQQAD